MFNCINYSIIYENFLFSVFASISHQVRPQKSSMVLQCLDKHLHELHITLLYSRRPTDLRFRQEPAALAQLVGADVSG